jgi:hypothetical protein
MAQSVPEPTLPAIATGRNLRRMPSRRVRRPDPLPLETDDVPVVAVGTALWALALLVLLVLRLAGTEVRDWWLGMCGWGVALGLLGVVYTRRRRRALGADRS